MILDSSAIVAVVRDEPERAQFLEIMKSADRLGVGAPTVLESAMVLGPDSMDTLTAMFLGLGVEVLPFAGRHVSFAHSAFATYGKGQGHPAALNFGDCMSYALAKVSGEPLLFKGDDFTHTDITPAWLPEVS